MNNNQDNFNPQINNMNNQNSNINPTNQGRFFQNPTTTQTPKQFIENNQPVNTATINQNFQSQAPNFNQDNSINNINNINNFPENNNQPLNVIPENNTFNNQNIQTQQINVTTDNIQNIISINQINNQNDFASIGNTLNNQPQNINNTSEEEDFMLKNNQNKFINNEMEANDTGLNNLNIDDTYNNPTKIDYSQDRKVQENLKKKNTVTITSEGKVFLLIVAVLFIFTFIMPYIFDFFIKS